MDDDRDDTPRKCASCVYWWPSGELSDCIGPDDGCFGVRRTAPDDSCHSWRRRSVIGLRAETEASKFAADILMSWALIAKCGADYTGDPNYTFPGLWQHSLVYHSKQWRSDCHSVPAIFTVTVPKFAGSRTFRHYSMQSAKVCRTPGVISPFP